MPTTLTNYEAAPVELENPKAAGIFRRSLDAVEWYNPSGETVIQGEPILFGGRIWVSKNKIKPATVGVLTSNNVVDYPCDALAGNLMQGATVWWDIDAADSDYPCGKAAVAAPTNGFLLGTAVIDPDNVTLTGGQPIAAPTGALTIRVCTYQTGVVAIGSIPDFN